MKYKKFEELPVWQDARKLNRAIYQIYNMASECRKQIKGFRKYLRDYFHEGN